MSNKKKNKPPSMDGLTQQELTELKLKMEIEKLYFETADKKRNWLYKNSGILIPSLIALATILTGVITGYFSAATTKLENQKHDLQDSINVFQTKKDILNHRNQQLNDSNNFLLTSQKSLQEDNNNLKVKNDVLQDSVRTGKSKLLTTESQKNKLQKDITTLSTQKSTLSKEVIKKNEEIINANTFLPITTLIENFIAQGNTLVLTEKKSEFNSLINKLKDGLENSQVKNYIQSKILDSSISKTSKYVISSACYFASKNNEWKRAFRDILASDFIYQASNNQKYYTNFNRNQIPLISVYSQMSYWSAIDRHENNKLLIDFVLKNVGNQITFFEDKVLFSIIKFDYSNSLGGTEDTLIAPKYNPSSFISFLKAYRSLLLNNKKGLTDLEFHSKWAKIYTAFVAIIITKDTAYKLPKNYLLDGNYSTINRPSGYLIKTIGKDYLNNKALWEKWVDDNKELCKRLIEPNFESYKKNTALLISDFAFDPSGSPYQNKPLNIDLKKLFSRQ